MSKDPEERSDWWERNITLREAMELPPYEPPRFEDDIYTHHVIAEVEEEHGCHILFRGVNTHYQEDWNVQIDGEDKFKIGKSRDKNGNTIYEMRSTEFKSEIEEHV
ncbi:hypothetical protein [Natronorubrum sp. FCH18a]|uniref:hypothetical protein n=1 Tax=Natronorubrum sp. FCH18a TaxID=3447018 RepID=UPI003F516AB5